MAAPESMQAAAGEPRILSFGVFEVDRRSREIRKRGLRVKLGEQPFRILELLLERPGDVVTREEIIQALWPGDTFVEFDHGINAAMQKLRRAVGDSPRNPRFIETLPKRGYRFLAAVQAVDGPGALPLALAGKNRKRNTLEGTGGGIPGWLAARLSASRLVFAGIALAIAISLTAGLRFVTQSEGPHPGVPLRKFAITPPAEIWAPAISPDGARVAYTQVGGEAGLWVQDFNRREPRPVAGAAGAQRPFWSPDGRSLAFGTPDGLYRVSLADYVAVRLCGFPRTRRPDGSVQPGHYQGGVWGPAGDTLYFSLREGGVYRIGESSGEPELLFGEPNVESLNVVSAQASSPKLLYAKRTDARFGTNEIVIRELETGKRTVLFTTTGAGPEPVYANSGHIIYRQQDENSDSLWAVPVSLDKAAVSGDPFLVAEYGRYPSVSRRGDLTYLEMRPAGMQQLVWRERSGRRLSFAGEPQTEIREPALSPDGRFAAVMGRERNLWDIWVHDLSGGSKIRLTSYPVIEAKPNWTPDGKEVVFLSAHEPSGVGRLYAKSTDGSSPLRALEAPPNVYASGFARDGTGLVFHALTREAGWDVKLLTYGPVGPAIRPLTSTSFDELEAQISPDSRLVAYCSNEPGRMEVYVQELAGKERRWRVSDSGGTGPRWRGDSGELFFVNGEALWSAAVTADNGAVSVGTPHLLFEDAGLATPQSYPQYDVSADGNRILAIDVLEEAPARCIRVVQNWYSEFQAPAG